MERDFKGIWISRDIYLHESLTPTEKLLLAEIDSFSKNGQCFASNDHFAKFLCISKNHVSKLISKLAKMGLVHVDIIYKKGTKEVEKRIIKPLIIYTYTPNHVGVDPLIIEEDTPIPQSIDSLLVDDYDKEQFKNTIKIQEKKKKNTKKKKPDTLTPELEIEFDDFWEIYPFKRGGRTTALTSFIKARQKKKVEYEVILNGLKRYIEYIKAHNTDAEYVSHASTWLNQERWQDPYIIATTQKTKGSFMDFYKSKFGGDINAIPRNSPIIGDNPSQLSESSKGNGF